MFWKHLKFLLLLPCVALNSYAQQPLDLFQATENPEQDSTSSRRPQREAQRVTEPAFTLVGTSRFGNEYYASLLHRDGSPVRVEWVPGGIVEIKGYNGYGLAQVTSRKVSIRLPEAEPCVANEAKGVSCNGQIALLSLSNAAPVERELPVRGSTDNGDDAGIIQGSDDGSDPQITGEPGQETIGNTNVLAINPFSGEAQAARNLTPEELAAREERRQARAERFSQFEIIRIPDDEIPEGMERIRTPFGDRLEPIEE